MLITIKMKELEVIGLNFEIFNINNLNRVKSL